MKQDMLSEAREYLATIRDPFAGTDVFHAADEMTGLVAAIMSDFATKKVRERELAIADVLENLYGVDIEYSLNCIIDRLRQPEGEKG